MIEGLKLRIPSEELAAHCKERSAYHKRRGEQKTAELPALRDAMDRVKTAGRQALENLPSSVPHMNKGGYAVEHEDPVKALETDIRMHQNSALVFAYFAEHFFPEVYVLGEADLQRLEILKR